MSIFIIVSSCFNITDNIAIIVTSLFVDSAPTLALNEQFWLFVGRGVSNWATGWRNQHFRSLFHYISYYLNNMNIKDFGWFSTCNWIYFIVKDFLLVYKRKLMNDRCIVFISALPSRYNYYSVLNHYFLK